MINISRIPGAFTVIFLSRGARHAARPVDLEFCEIEFFHNEEREEDSYVLVDGETFIPIPGEGLGIFSDCHALVADLLSAAP